MAQNSNDSNQSQSATETDDKIVTFIKTFTSQPTRPRYAPGFRSQNWIMEYGENVEQ